MKRHGTLESLNGIVEDSKTYKYAKQELTYRREYMLMYKYKLTIDQFNDMKEDGCNICGDSQERAMQVDHDHSCCSGEGATCGQCVRGVVCNRCNQTIGKYETGLIRDDNPLKDKIKEYLNGQKR
jgi:hypothetical protein